jgi:hypothetical protein
MATITSLRRVSEEPPSASLKQSEVRRIRRRTCAAHFDGLQPKSANLPDGSTALPWPQSQVSEESPRSHPVPGLKQSEVREVQREVRERYDTCKCYLRG